MPSRQCSSIENPRLFWKPSFSEKSMSFFSERSMPFPGSSWILPEMPWKFSPTFPADCLKAFKSTTKSTTIIINEIANLINHKWYALQVICFENFWKKWYEKTLRTFPLARWVKPPRPRPLLLGLGRCRLRPARPHFSRRMPRAPTLGKWNQKIWEWW